MRQSNLFWAIILILAGVIFLLSNLGLLAGINVWSLLWPLALIALGLFFIWGTLRGPRMVEAEPGAVPLDGAARARIKISHGAGRLVVRAGAGPNEVAAGAFGGGLEVRARRDGDALDVKLRPREHAWVMPWGWQTGGLDWDVRLNGDIPLTLKLDTGASHSVLDLSDLRVSELKLETHASATEVTLPARAGLTQVKIESGAASVKVAVPGGVAARIRVRGGLARFDIDQTRFPLGGDIYQSPDFASAVNRVEMDLETGVGSVEVR